MRRKNGIVVSVLCGAFFCLPAHAAPAPAPADSKAPVTASYDPETGKLTVDKDKSTLPGGYIKMSGRYRLGFGIDSEDFILNEANGEYQERDFRYLFGERQDNTHDREIYSQHLLNVEFSPVDRWSFYTQIVNDPWSLTGTTGEQITRSSIGSEEIRYNLKYFGAYNSTINEIYSTDQSDYVSIPVIKVIDGRTTPQTVRGFFDFSPATGGVPFNIPSLDIDYEYRPIRKLWADYTSEEWYARFFALADEKQALSTDDPLMLSNRRDYWQQSPWLYQYEPIKHFSNRAIRRGYYSDVLSFQARDSEGNRLVLLRGAAFEGEWDKTYLAATVAAPYTPWDEDFTKADNIPGAVRLKHQVTDSVMLGGVYGFRSGLIDSSIADLNQVFAVDTRIQTGEFTNVTAQVARSTREHDLLSDQSFNETKEGHAYRIALDSSCLLDSKNELQDGSAFHLSLTQMDRDFETTLSRYTNTRDDRYWANHLTFDSYGPTLEPFRLGDGIDRNRIVLRAQWRERRYKQRFENLIDVRNVHRATNSAYMETVAREELTYKITDKLTFKGLVRAHWLPTTTDDVEPFLSNFYFANVGIADPSSMQFQSTDVLGGRDADRYTFAGALQYVIDQKWTAEGFYERTNDVPDFPRGLLNNTFLNASDRVDGIILSRVQPFLYGQAGLGAIPPYEYFDVFRERVIFTPEHRVKVIFHAAQNGYDFAGGIDDNVTHEGVSLQFDPSKKWSWFFDYTHSRTVDVPHYVNSGYTQRIKEDHHNVYTSVDYRINSSTVLRSEYGVFGLGRNRTALVTPYDVSTLTLPTVDTEHLFRMTLTGDF